MPTTCSGRSRSCSRTELSADCASTSRSKNPSTVPASTCRSGACTARPRACDGIYLTARYLRHGERDPCVVAIRRASGRLLGRIGGGRRHDHHHFDDYDHDHDHDHDDHTPARRGCHVLLRRWGPERPTGCNQRAVRGSRHWRSLGRRAAGLLPGSSDGAAGVRPAALHSFVPPSVPERSQRRCNQGVECCVLVLRVREHPTSGTQARVLPGTSGRFFSRPTGSRRTTRPAWPAHRAVVRQGQLPGPANASPAMLRIVKPSSRRKR